MSRLPGAKFSCELVVAALGVNLHPTDLGF